ncbi:restriction endonuclease subunit S [Vibrio cholerae]|nr:restriction endonuclease subunit S [Vibrio cholerae]
MDAIIDYRGKTPTKTTSGIPLITAKIIKNGRIQDVNEYIAEGDYDAWMRRGLPKEGDVVLTTEAPLGEVAQLDSRKIALAQRVITLRGKKGVLDNDYLLYLLQSHDVQHQLDGRGTGSTVKGIKQSELKEIILSFPSINVQKRIAQHLKNIDQKITINRQINQTLEQMAQTLFKSWFVDFDPVIDNALDADTPIPDELQHRAEVRKAVRESEGFKPLPDDVRQLFPDAFEESELGWVPKGWGSGCLADIASYTSNRVATTKLSLNNYVSTENMLAEKKGIVEAASLPTVNTVPAYTTGNVLISNIRPYFKKIWMANGEGGHSNDVLGFAAKEQNTEGYLFNLLYQDALFEFMMTTAKGSKMPRGDKKAILGWQLVIPPCELREYFSQRVADFYVSSSKRTEENKTLSKLRDTLLPKLISGELRLDEVELAVEQEAVSTEQQNER